MGTSDSVRDKHIKAEYSEEAASTIAVIISELCSEHTTIKHDNLSFQILDCSHDKQTLPYEFQGNRTYLSKSTGRSSLSIQLSQESRGCRGE